MKSYQWLQHRYISFIGVCIVTGLLSGCFLKKPFTPPCSEIPIDWKEEILSPTSSIGENWWEVFEDPELNSLETTAILNNQDLKVAAARVLEARALTQVNQAGLFPHITFEPSFQTLKSLNLFFIPPAITSAVPGLPDSVAQQNLQPVYQLPFNLSYELDLWGKVLNSTRSAFATAEAQDEALRTVLLTMTSDIAKCYFELRQFDAQISLAQEISDIRKENVRLYQRDFEVELRSFLDVANANLQQTDAESDLVNLFQKRQLIENQLALLTGQQASLFKLKVSSFNETPPTVPVGLPSDLMLRRPDIAEAERKLASEYAQINVARANFFPSIQLTGGIGFLSPSTELAKLVEGRSHFWAMGADNVLNLFNGGKNFANLDAAKARYEQAYAAYQQQVLVAFREVEDALSTLRAKNKVYEISARASKAAWTAQDIAENRYSHELIDYFAMTETKIVWLAKEREKIGVQFDRYASTINLIKAIGGGWEID